MFTGIIEFVGVVVRVGSTPQRREGASPAHLLEIDLGPVASGLESGASVAVNGACLTLTECRGHVGSFDVVPETWRRTTLGRLRPQDRVNLERSLRADARIDGHFVQGHVDGIATVERVDRGGGEWMLWVRTPPELMPFIVPKGSVALDGTSLTVVDVHADRFSVALVPTTLRRTTLVDRRPGEALNVETDVLARLVFRQLEAFAGQGSSDTAAPNLTWEKLREGGFV